MIIYAHSVLETTKKTRTIYASGFAGFAFSAFPNPLDRFKYCQLQSLICTYSTVPLCLRHQST